MKISDATIDQQRASCNPRMIYERVGENISPATRDVSTLSLDGTDLYTRRLMMEVALFNMR